MRTQIAGVLKQDHRVLVFPEGTTTDGTSVLPFRGGLLTAANEAQRPIQAITLAYRRDGLPDPVVPFIGDDCFQNHLVRLLRKPAVTVDIIFHPPLAAADMSSQQLAQALHRQIAQGMADLDARQPAREPGETATGAFGR